jgi:hypothetical protein
MTPGKLAAIAATEPAAHLPINIIRTTKGTHLASCTSDQARTANIVYHVRGANTPAGNTPGRAAGIHRTTLRDAITTHLTAHARPCSCYSTWTIGSVIAAIYLETTGNHLSGDGHVLIHKTLLALSQIERAEREAGSDNAVTSSRARRRLTVAHTHLTACTHLLAPILTVDNITALTAVAHTLQQLTSNTGDGHDAFLHHVLTHTVGEPDNVDHHRELIAVTRTGGPDDVNATVSGIIDATAIAHTDNKTLCHIPLWALPFIMRSPTGSHELRTSYARTEPDDTTDIWQTALAMWEPGGQGGSIHLHHCLTVARHLHQ